MEKFYQSMISTIKNTPYLEKMILTLSHFLPYITFCIYPSVLLYLLIKQSPLFYPTLYKPMIAFLIVSFFRKIINRKRPYESMNIEPLIQHKQGESFPSRHTVSAFIIALVCLNVHLGLGIMMLIIASLISLTRILSGVHYISDVISAIMIAYIIYII